MLRVYMDKHNFSEWFEVQRNSYSIESVGEDDKSRIIKRQNYLCNRGGAYYTEDEFYLVQTFEEMDELIKSAELVKNQELSSYRKIAEEKLK